MKKRELYTLGIPKGKPMDLAIGIVRQLARTGMSRGDMRAKFAGVAEKPEDYKDDQRLAELAAALVESAEARSRFEERTDPAPYQSWGFDFDETSVRQIENACKLPVSVAGALMPDAHTGYGLPIGGVLATKNAVIPYAVGMDIACRMKMTVFDMPVSAIRGEEGHLRNALERETSFGVGRGFERKRDHEVMDEDWSVSPITQRDKDKAWKQLGSSGSGNHFVEFGTLTLDKDDLALKAGVYFALLSHSGSRGTGGNVAQHYSKVAMDLRPELPRELLQLAWFDLDSGLGQEYWAAMELMGRYAAANHKLIHHHIAKSLKAKVLLDIENHHNFAWKERHFGEDVIVHRKGATPAGDGVVGIIPGSMATPGYVCRGKGKPESMNSASHGAGRAMSRTATKNSFTWSEAKKVLQERDVVLISAGLDEVPMGYKDIEKVMAAQSELVDIVARFDPKLVKMAPGERPGIEMNMSLTDRILQALRDIEAEEGVTILYACESGSRAWGFESEDSDYDVRFIYLRPTNWYLTIQNKRDVIEKPIDDELDVSGWDVPKALELLRKSNPPLLEWLQSPIVYRRTSTLHARLCAVMPHYYSPMSCMFHYLHMAENNFRKYLKDDQVWTKKYFYVLRPVLACMWIEKGHGAVPMEFETLLNQILAPGKLRSEIQALLEAKRNGAELDKGTRNDVISSFLEAELTRLRAEHQPPADTRDPHRLDELFAAIIKEVNGPTIDSVVD